MHFGVCKQEAIGSSDALLYVLVCQTESVNFLKTQGRDIKTHWKMSIGFKHERGRQKRGNGKDEDICASKAPALAHNDENNSNKKNKHKMPASADNDENNSSRKNKHMIAQQVQ